MNISKYVKTANVLRCNVKRIYYGGLTLPETHLASINHITSLGSLNLILRATHVYLLL